MEEQSGEPMLESFKWPNPYSEKEHVFPEQMFIIMF